MSRAAKVKSPVIGVLALQGDVAEHRSALQQLGVRSPIVRRPAELDDCDGLIVPGGESTTIDKLARTFGLHEPIARRIEEGMAAFGTCAGMIMLAERLSDAAAGQQTFGGLDVTVRRNAFGRQVASFESPIDFADFADPVTAVFIRAPWVEQVGTEVEVLATVTPPDGAGDKIVAVRQGRVLAMSFHPEVADDLRLHRYFLDLVTS